MKAYLFVGELPCGRIDSTTLF